MKIEPLEVLTMIADSAEEIVNEQTRLSEEVLIVMRLMTEKIKNKLFAYEIKDLGLSEEEIQKAINKVEG